MIKTKEINNWSTLKSLNSLQSIFWRYADLPLFCTKTLFPLWDLQKSEFVRRVILGVTTIFLGFSLHLIISHFPCSLIKHLNAWGKENFFAPIVQQHCSSLKKISSALNIYIAAANPRKTQKLNMTYNEV